MPAKELTLKKFLNQKEKLKKKLMIPSDHKTYFYLKKKNFKQKIKTKTKIFVLEI